MTNWSIGATLSFATNIDSRQLDLSGWSGFLLPVHESNYSRS
nr:MAG TPA: hypothetical protein [Caudoviricetes sp.]